MTLLLDRPAPPLPDADGIVYPDSDGEPMADNTKQFDLMTTWKYGLDIQHQDSPDVFVAGDLLWYPVRGNNTLRQAPDVMVAFGRPKGYRGSYKQWEEGDVPPQVVFEVLSPGNRAGEMARKFDFYQRYGVEEYYVYDPDRHTLAVWFRDASGALVPVPDPRDFISPRLGVRFVLPDEGDLTLYYPDGTPFLSPVEIARQRAEAERRLSETEGRQREAEERAERLAARLRALGIDPDDPAG
jgi:hypothetical protein